MKDMHARSMLAAVGMATLAGCGSTVSEGEHGLQSDGSFVLNEAERAESCSTIHAEMRRLSDEIVLADKKNRQEVASSIAYGVLFGVAGAATYRMTSNAGAAGKAAERNRAKLIAYDANLQSQGCEPWNHQEYIARKKAANNEKYAAQRRANRAEER